jgi:hypothetical protein
MLGTPLRADRQADGEDRMITLDDLVRRHRNVDLKLCRIGERVRVIADIATGYDGRVVVFHETVEQALVIVLEKLRHGDDARTPLLDEYEKHRERYAKEFWDGNAVRP